MAYTSLSSPLASRATFNSIRARFGARLRSLRKRRGSTQVELADYLGLRRTYISDLERGKRNVSLLTLEIVARDLGCRCRNCCRGFDGRNDCGNRSSALTERQGENNKEEGPFGLASLAYRIASLNFSLAFGPSMNRWSAVRLCPAPPSHHN